MFAADYFADSYFEGGYWDHGVTVPPVVPSGGGGHSEVVYRRTRHKAHPVTIDAGKRPARPSYTWHGRGGGILVGGGATVLFTPWADDQAQPAVDLAAPVPVLQSAAVVRMDPGPMPRPLALPGVAADSAPAAAPAVQGLDEALALLLLDDDF